MNEAIPSLEENRQAIEAKNRRRSQRVVLWVLVQLSGVMPDGRRMCSARRTSSREIFLGRICIRIPGSALLAHKLSSHRLVPCRDLN
jgi:hypothetical protein